MKVFSFSPPDRLAGLKILSYEYSRSKDSLAGDWRVTLESADEYPLHPGDTVSLEGMTGGMVGAIYPGSSGEIIVSGRDRGIYLMRSVPQVEDIAEGGAKEVIEALAGLCGVSVRMSGGLSGFNARSLITGSTCAEAIQELAMLSGKMAYIDNDGVLVVADPSGSVPAFSTILSDGGESLDLDSYATGATVIVQRRRERDAEKAGGTKVVWRGSTPSGFLTTETFSGSTGLSDGDFSYEIEVYEQIRAPKSIRQTTRTGATTKVYETVYDYNIETFTEIRGDQEYRVFEWSLASEISETTVSGAFPASDGTSVSFSETTTRTMTRSYTISGEIESETEESITTRTSSLPAEGNISPTPPFDYRIERKFNSSIFGDARTMTEVEQRYEKRGLSKQVPVINPATGQPVTIPGTETFVLVSEVEFEDWILIESTRTVNETLEEDECTLRASFWHSDNGAADLLSRGMTLPNDIYNPNISDSEKVHIALDQDTGEADIEIYPGGSSLRGDVQRVEFAGRKRVYINKERSIEGSEDWYLDGGYVPSRVCPHYSGGICGISDIAVVGGTISGDKCPYRGINWRGCERAQAALEKAREDDADERLLETPVICTAGGGNVWTSREIYIDDIITDAEAESIGNAVAANILTAKGGARGISKTVTIPLEYDLHPTGTITAVTHDWEGLKTSVTYKIAGSIPDLLIPETVAGAAAMVANREASRQQRGHIGKVLTIGDDGIITVLVANMAVRCTTRLKYLAENDTVLVSLPAGSRGFGVVTERL